MWFYFNYTASTYIDTYLHTLSRPDALPICSPGSIIFDKALSIVVLPEPVPPEMTMLNRHAPAILSAVAILSDIDPNLAIMSSVIGLAENLRIEIAVPRKLSGGTLPFTRETSLRPASASGVVG